MLKFFRKIRQKLINEGNLKRYLIYAVGEVLLVMIGILLALQVNNWNESRKEKQFEINLLVELRDNLLEDIVQNENQIILQNTGINHIEKLIDHLDSKFPFSDTLNFVTVTYFEIFNVNRAAYETLKNGGVEKLSSIQLKKKLSNYYDNYAIGRAKIVELSNNSQYMALENISWEKRKTYQGDQDYEKFIFSIASENRFYINYLYARKKWKGQFINDILKANIKHAESIISIIENELLESEN